MPRRKAAFKKARKEYSRKRGADGKWEGFCWRRWGEPVGENIFLQLGLRGGESGINLKALMAIATPGPSGKGKEKGGERRALTNQRGSKQGQHGKSETDGKRTCLWVGRAGRGDQRLIKGDDFLLGNKLTGEQPCDRKERVAVAICPNQGGKHYQRDTGKASKGQLEGAIDKKGEA